MEPRSHVSMRTPHPVTNTKSEQQVCSDADLPWNFSGPSRVCEVTKGQIVTRRQHDV